MGYGFTPTPDPSPQGGGEPACVSRQAPVVDGFACQSGLKIPSSLCGGVRGGGTIRRNFLPSGLAENGLTGEGIEGVAA
jgi:hypothetical protein